MLPFKVPAKGERDVLGEPARQAAQFSPPDMEQPKISGQRQGEIVNNSLYNVDKEVDKISAPAVGINPAKSQAMTFIPFSIAPDLAPAPVLGEVETFLKTETVRLIERIETAATQASKMRGSKFEMTIELDSGEQVAVRMALKDGKVQTAFQTDIPGLRESLDLAWTSLVARRELGTLRWAEPTFSFAAASAPAVSSSAAPFPSSSDSSGFNAATDDSGARDRSQNSTPHPAARRPETGNRPAEPAPAMIPPHPSNPSGPTGLRAFA